ncbi:MAG: winged helix-turn-helix transcriptional regulator [Candidatus Lokiarchaeota archaeon]|nr:winged helix-turn-helix transcriptional regulator [Candidatus Harpocratesius repetitus]
MDIEDHQLIQVLLQNSRIIYRNMAQLLNLSVNAVHNQVQNLIDREIIQA